MSDAVRARVVMLLLLVVVFAAVPAFLSWMDRGYFYQVAKVAMIFALLAASMHLITGVAGLLQLGHAAFYGVGAYAAALLAESTGLPILVTIPFAGVAAAFAALLVALPTMRLVSIYFAVATLGFGQMLYLVMLNWVGLTKGPNGILLFGKLQVFGVDFSSQEMQYWLVAVVVMASLWAIHRLSHSYYGNALRALREDDQCAEAMGLDTVRLKIEAFTLSGFFAGNRRCAVGPHRRLHLAAGLQFRPVDPDPDHGGGRRAGLAARRHSRCVHPHRAARAAALRRRHPQHPGRAGAVLLHPVPAARRHRRGFGARPGAPTARRRLEAQRGQ